MPKIFKAVHFDVSVEDEELTTTEITKWILMALVDYCSFNDQGVRIRKKKDTIHDKKSDRCVVFEIEILAQPNLTDQDVVDKLVQAFQDFCEFERFSIKLVRSHDCVVMDFDEPAES